MVNPTVFIPSGDTTYDLSPWTTVTPAQLGIQAAQPMPTPPAPAGWVPRDPSDYFTSTAHKDVFKAYRNQKRTHNILSRGPGVDPWTEQDEIKLVDQLWLDWFGEHYPGQSWSFDDLDLDKLEEIPLRQKKLPPFKIEYETYAEMKLRFFGTIISIKGHPFHVVRIHHHPEKGFLFGVSDGHHIKSVAYKDIPDLRSIPPMYVTMQQPGWLCRHPGRVYQQGLNRHNTVVKSVDSGSSLFSFNAEFFLQTFPKRTDRKWDGTVKSLMESGELPVIRLSDDVAVGNIRHKIVACYRGRSLGIIKDNEITVHDEDDLLQEWIERSVKQVGLELRAQG